MKEIFLLDFYIGWFLLQIYLCACVRFMNNLLYLIMFSATFWFCSICVFVLLFCWVFFTAVYLRVRYVFLFFFLIMSCCSAGPTCLLGADLYKDGPVSNSYNETEDVSKINPWSVDEACLPAKHAAVITKFTRGKLHLLSCFSLSSFFPL